MEIDMCQDHRLETLRTDMVGDRYASGPSIRLGPKHAAKVTLDSSIALFIASLIDSCIDPLIH